MFAMFAFYLLSLAPAPSMAAPVVRNVSTVNVLVTDRAGRPVRGAHVVVDGISDREGQTDAAGHVVFRNVKAGRYMLQIERDQFITLQKDFAVKAGQGKTTVSAAISPSVDRVRRCSGRTSC